MLEDNKELEEDGTDEYKFRFFHMGRWETHRITRKIACYSNKTPIATQSADTKVRFDIVSTESFVICITFCKLHGILIFYFNSKILLKYQTELQVIKQNYGQVYAKKRTLICMGVTTKSMGVRVLKLWLTSQEWSLFLSPN